MLLRQEVLDYMRQGHNKCETARKFGIKDPKTIRDWVKTEEKLKGLSKDRSIKLKERRTLLKPKNPKYKKVDEMVLEAYRKHRENKLKVDVHFLQSQAKAAYREVFPTEDLQMKNPFSASTGWVTRFCNRNRIKSRAITSLGQKVPPNAKEIALNFFEQMRVLRKTGNFVVYNMDQMPVYVDSPKNRTYDDEGKDEVPLKTTGHEKTRFTLMLGADNIGRKLKPTIIFRGLTKPPKGCPEGIHVMAGWLRRYR